MAGQRELYLQVEDPIGNKGAAEKEAGIARRQNLCFLPGFKRGFLTLPNIIQIFKVAQMRGLGEYC